MVGALRGFAAVKRPRPCVAADEARNPNLGRNFWPGAPVAMAKTPRAHRFRLAICEHPVDRHLADNLTSVAFPQFAQADVAAIGARSISPDS
jgi:hypothetical protein